MLTESQAREFANDWVRGRNSHDLDAIMSHYGSSIALVSPVAANLLGDPSGMVVGEPALRNYFKRGLELFPNLTFQVVDVMWGLSSIVLYYKNQNGTMTGEFMELDASLKVTKVVAHYNR